MSAERICKIQTYMKHLHEYGIMLVPSQLAGEIQVELAGLKVNYTYKAVGEIFQFEVPEWRGKNNEC